MVWFNAPDPCPDPLTLQRLFLPRSLAGLAPCWLQSIWKSPGPNPDPAVRVPAWRAGAAQREPEAGIFKSRPQLGLRDNAAQMAIPQDNERCPRPPLTSKLASRPRRANARSCAMMQGPRAAKTALAQRLIPMPRARAGVSRGGSANPRHIPERQLEGPLKVRRRSRAATAGEHLCPPAAPRLAPPPLEMWLISPPHPPSRRPPRSHTADESCSRAPCRSVGRGCGPHVVPAANLSNSNTPIGPFQITVLQSAKASLEGLDVNSGPMSRPIQPSGIAFHRGGG